MTEKNHESEDQNKAEAQAFIRRYLEQIQDNEELQQWQAAFIAGKATSESYPLEVWKRLYFSERASQGSVIILSTRSHNKAWVQRLIEEAERHASVPHYRWDIGPGDEPSGIETKDV